MRDWQVTLLIALMTIIIAVGGTYTSIQMVAKESSIRIESLSKQVEYLRISIDQQDRRLDKSEISGARIAEAAEGQARAVESLSSVVSKVARSLDNIASSLTGMNVRMDGFEKRSSRLEDALRGATSK
jgi:uncharacterized protein YoxC